MRRFFIGLTCVLFVLPGLSFAKEVLFVAPDAHHRRAVEELKLAYEWANGEKVILSEFGVPTMEDHIQYAALIDFVYRVANTFGMSTAAWAEGAHWYTDYALRLEVEGSVTDIVRSMSSRHDAMHCVSMAGGEFGFEARSVPTNPDIYKHNWSYFYHVDRNDAQREDEDLMWKRISEHWSCMRFPIRLERVTDVQDGSLKQSELRYLRLAFERARSEDLMVILDPHNYAELIVDDVLHKMGEGAFPVSLYLEMMKSLVVLAQEYPDVIMMIGLMNEPQAAYSEQRLQKLDWEDVTQQALDVIRTAGYAGCIEVPIGNWQGPQDLSWMHPAGPWINDPLEDGCVYYGIHQYYNPSHSGYYDATYAEDEAALRDMGFEPGIVSTTLD